MRVYCSITGIDFEVPNCFGNKVRIFDRDPAHLLVHPIFHADVKVLLEKILPDWAARKLTEHETKLLFLAFLHSTGLVEWKTIAYPSIDTCEKYMERLVKIVTWHNSVRSPQLAMPKIAITKEVYGNNTSTLRNIGNWIESWEDAQQQWYDGYRTQVMSDRLASREAALDKVINSPYRKEEAWIWMLADWALVAGKVPMDVREKWKEVFKTKGIDVFKLDLAYLQNMILHFQTNLDFSRGTLYPHKTLSYLRTLHSKAKFGLNLGLEFSEEELSKLDYNEIINTSFTMKEDSVQEHNRHLAIAAAPADPPKEEDYPHRWMFLRAQGQYRIAQREYAKMQAAEDAAKKKLADESRNEILDAINAREDVDTSEEDQFDLGLDLPKPKTGEEI